MSKSWHEYTIEERVEVVQRELLNDKEIIKKLSASKDYIEGRLVQLDITLCQLNALLY